MQVQNLHFFDKFGRNLNLLFNVDRGVWEGKIYLEPISIFLFDNENLFVLEEVGALYKFPTLLPDQGLEFSWSSNENEAEFFLYDVEEDLELDERFINKVQSKTVLHSDIDPGGTSALDLRVPLQVNIAFNPSDEKKFERTLRVYLVDALSPTNKTQIAEIYFYGEGIDEDERFGVWANNFGIKFLREDANILKDYDIKEALPDYEALNQARKELLVNKEHIYPYIGTYKGLSNFVNILGYKDVLQIKEYWTNVNPRSSYFKKLLMVDISDYLDDGKIDTFDLVDRNRNIKEGKQFRKTEFLAIVYQFTRATDNFDDDGIPIVEETTEFTVNEIFYKLNRLAEKVKNEFLPVNVKIRDVIGEFIYFQKFTISYWKDGTQIFDYDLNDPAKIGVYPGESVNLTLRALDPLYRRVSDLGIDFGVARINNNGAKNPFEVQQKYTKLDNQLLADNIREFYTEIRDQRIPNLGKRLTWEFGDDPERVIGAPVIFTLDIPKFLVGDLKGVKLDELDEIAPGLDPYWTLENIDYRNFYEVNWKIIKSAPNPYYFEHRGRVVDLFQLAHVLPYAGTYRVIVELFDFYGGVSVFSRFVTVQDDMKPEIVAFSRLEDKFDYHISNLANVQLQDFGASHLYYPKVNVLDNEKAAEKIDIYKNLIEWISFFKNRYGMGQNLYDVEIYDDDIDAYVSYVDPIQNHPKKLYWGLGEDDVPITLRDLRDIEIGDLYWLRLTNLVHLDDFKAGFYMRNPKPGSKIQASIYPEYIIPPFSTLDELVGILNTSDHPFIKLFNYEIINGRKSDGQYIIHAQAEYLSKIMYHMLGLPCEGSPSPSPDQAPVLPFIPGFSPSPGSPTCFGGDEYTFFLPKKVFSPGLVEYLQSISPVFDSETLFLLAKTSDVLSGAVQDPSFWQEKKYWKYENGKQIGHLPTTIDQNAFNITDIKLFEESFYVPENAFVFFVIDNLDGKSDFLWTLTDSSTGEEVFRARSVPFFVWKFKDLGTYQLSVTVTDNRGTQYSSQVRNFVRVLGKRQYISETESRLNRRKLELLRSRA